MINEKESVIVHIVPSTHWDREWYLTQRRFQFKLIRLMDKVLELLEGQDYATFLLDGQTIMLEDYFEIRPEAQERVKKFVKDGKLVVGPWYVVPDLFIPSGESLIRNLSIGRSIAEKYGCLNDIGYTPDSFGLISQIPQIFNQFGLKGIVFCRGLRTQNGERGSEFIWSSPDGSKLPALYEGYNTGVFLSYQDIWKNLDYVPFDEGSLISQARNVLEQQSHLYSSRHKLWVVGIDHIEPRKNLPDIIRLLSEKIPEVHFIHSTVKAYFEGIFGEMEKFPGIYGEQRGPEKEHFVLGNTLSSRADIKLTNRECESLLQDWADPLAVYAKNVCCNSFNTWGFLNTAWKLLIQNHAHDSICSCNSDDTNRDIITRLRQVKQIASDIRDCHLQEIGSALWYDSPGSGNKAVIMVYNASGWTQSGIARGCVRVPFELLGESFNVLDESGSIVPGAIVRLLAKKRWDLETMKMSDEELLLDTTRSPLGRYESHDIYTLLEVAWLAEDVPSQGYRCYEVVPMNPVQELSSGEEDSREDVLTYPNGMENRYYRININPDSTLDILNKETGKWLKGIHYIEDEADDGDTYTFSPLLDDKPYTTCSTPPTVELLECGRTRAAYRISWKTELPEALVQRKERSISKKEVSICSEIALVTGNRRIEFRTKIDNAVKDHRMRVVFNFPYKTNSVRSDTPFDVIERPVFSYEELPGASIQTKPMRNVLHIPFHKVGGDDVLILSRGCCEYEVIHEEKRSKVALTLFRSIGAVYHMVTSTKDESLMGNGTRWWTAEGQCLKEMEFEYGLVIASNPIDRGDTIKEGVLYNAPLRPVAINPKGAMPATYSFLRLSPHQLVLSTVTRMEDKGDGVFIRFYHPGDECINARLEWHIPIKEAYEVMLSGERIKKLDVYNEKIVECPVSAGEIKTIEIFS